MNSFHSSGVCELLHAPDNYSNPLPARNSCAYGWLKMAMANRALLCETIDFCHPSLRIDSSKKKNYLKEKLLRGGMFKYLQKLADIARPVSILCR